MKLVDNKVWEYFQGPGIDGVYKSISDAARICYQTDEAKMKLSPKEFVENVLLKNAHCRPLEFGTVYLKVPVQDYLSNRFDKGLNKLLSITNGIMNFSNYNEFLNDYYITTNMRVIMQGDYETDKEAHANGYDKNFQYLLDKYWCEPTKYHPRRRTFTMWMSRGCTDDNRTHVTLSSICESTRFCNYSKDKFGNELTFIKPYWIKDYIIDYWEKVGKANGDIVPLDSSWAKEQIVELEEGMQFLNHMLAQEHEYITASKSNLQPQQLKRIFPLGVKAELRLCGFDDAWENFFWRRCDEHADPECKLIADEIKTKLW